MPTAFVLTVSDGASAGTRKDESGAAVAARLMDIGFDAQRAVVPDEIEEIARAVTGAAETHALVVTTGGTGLGPRDTTPQALHGLLDYEIPGFGELMRAHGRASTPMADLSRSLAGVLGRCLVVAVPGSRRGALESLTAIEPLLEHALETLGGHTQHADTQG
jgi:molybdopterin adenylyltransferase